LQKWLKIVNLVCVLRPLLVVALHSLNSAKTDFKTK